MGIGSWFHKEGPEQGPREEPMQEDAEGLIVDPEVTDAQTDEARNALEAQFGGSNPDIPVLTDEEAERKVKEREERGDDTPIRQGGV